MFRYKKCLSSDSGCLQTLMDLFFLTAASFRLFFLKKLNFGIIPLIFTILEKKIRPRRHLPHLLKLTDLFLKNMSTFRANNHF